MIPGKWKNLLLATAMFNLGFVIWFSFAPFTGEIADEFGLSVAQLGIVSSAAVIAVPLGRIIIGPLTDKFGAPITASATLIVVGIFSIISAYAQTYEVFTVSRVIASLAGITFVIGIQHVASGSKRRIWDWPKGSSPALVTLAQDLGRTLRSRGFSVRATSARCSMRTGVPRSSTLA